MTYTNKDITIKLITITKSKTMREVNNSKGEIDNVDIVDIINSGFIKISS